MAHQKSKGFLSVPVGGIPPSGELVELNSTTQKGGTTLFNAADQQQDLYAIYGYHDAGGNMKIAYVILLLIILAAIVGCATEDTEITPMSKTLRSKPVETVQETTETQPEETYTPPETTTKTTTTKTTTTTTTTEMTFEQEEAKAIEAAKAFVKSLDGYKNQQGRELEVMNSAKTGCEGCWVFDIRFVRDVLYYPEKTERINVHVSLKNWKMETYTFR